MQIRPLSDRIIVKRIEHERKTAAGLVIPDNAAAKPEQGEVIAVGPGKVLKDGVRIAPAVKSGDRVLFAKYGGQEVKLDGQQLLVLREDDILAVVEDATAGLKKAA